MSVFRAKQVVSDGQGNHFAVTGVNPKSLKLRSVTTKEVFTVPLDYATMTLKIEEGLREA